MPTPVGEGGGGQRKPAAESRVRRSPFPPTDQPPVVVQGLSVPDVGVAIPVKPTHAARGRPGPPPAAHGLTSLGSAGLD